MYKICSTIFLLFYISSIVYNQNQNYKFEHLTINDGLSSNSITCIFQDSRGYLWFGTQDGLNKYDGYDITTLNYDPKDSLSLSSSYISDICEDKDDNLWVSTPNGLNKICLKNGEITRFGSGPVALYGQHENSINLLHFDQSGNLWVGKRNGLDCLTIHPNQETANQFVIKHYQSDTTKSNALVNNYINVIYEDNKGYLWIGTRGGLHKFDPGKEIFTVYKHNPQDHNSISHNNVHSIFEDSEGILWIGTRRGWLNRMNIRTGKFNHYKNYHLKDIVTITEDASGNLWFGALANRGLSCLVKEKNEFVHFKHDPSNKTSLRDNHINDLFIDNSGILWIAGYIGGVNILDPHKRKFEHYYHIPTDSASLSANHIWSICEDKTGKVWIATWGKGVDCFNPISGEFTNYKYNPDNPNSISWNWVRSICEDKSGSIWCGTERGLAKFNPETKIFTRYTANPSIQTSPKYLSNNNINSIYEDKDGFLWIGTYRGLNRFDKKSGHFTHFFRNPSDPNSRYVNLIVSIFEDKSGVLWINTNVGLYIFDKSTETFNRFILDPKDPDNHAKNFAVSFAEDRNDIWFGTVAGLTKLDKNSRKLSHYTTHDGLSGNIIYGILEDNSGMLWLSTNFGLCKFDPVSEKVRKYKTIDGLQSLEYNSGAYHKGQSGYFYFGGTNGFNRFHPDSIKDNPNIPMVHITSFKVLDKTYSFNKLNNEKNHIELSYDQNIFSFDFVALNYTNSINNQYAYFLEGFENNWIYCGTRRYARYTNVPPGEYVMRVKGSNNDNIWNEKGASIRIEILSPWWRTWWAYSSYLIVIVLVLYTFRKYDLKRQQLKHALASEHIHSRKLREIDKMKSRFFANISHEFRTPLTLILGPIDKLFSKTTDNDTKEELSIMQRSSKRLQRLINQLLDLSKLESGEMTLQLEKVDIVKLIKQYVQSFESLAKRKGIKLEFKSEVDEHIALFDTDKIEKILNNLLSNAFKFTQSGGLIKVSILTELITSEERSNQFPSWEGRSLSVVEGRGVGENRHNSFKIKVSDTGIGIPADRIDNIFDRFYQVDDSNRRDNEGTGIGLALTKELVELLGGSISVESEVEKGTTFTVILPIIKKETGDWKSETEKKKTKKEIEIVKSSLVQKSLVEEKFKETESLSPMSGLQPPIVLVVEDNPDMRAYICGHLKSNYKIIEAENGLKGFNKAIDNIPDLIISDVMMPKMDGIELSEKLKADERTSHIPVILLTARVETADRIEGLETGADDYLVKPFEAKELQVRIKNLIEQRIKLRQRFFKEIVLGSQEIKIDSLDEQFIKRLFDICQQHLSKPDFNVNVLGKEAGLSRSQLHRKLKGLTDKSATEFINILRLKRAAVLLKENHDSISKIAYDVGFNNLSYFNKSFKKLFGETPSDYIQNKKHDKLY